MCVPFSQNLKKKSVNGEQNMKILRKKRRNWPKKCQWKGKNKKTRQWISTTDQLHWQVTEWKLGDSQRSWNSKPQNKTNTNRKLEELKTQAQKALNLVEILAWIYSFWNLKTLTVLIVFLQPSQLQILPIHSQNMVVWLPQNQNMNNFILITKTQWRAYSF